MSASVRGLFATAKSKKMRDGVETPEVAFENLQIERLIAHQVPKLTPLNESQPAKHSKALETLSEAGKGALTTRLTTALGKGSAGVELAIGDAAEGSTFQLCAKLFDVEDVEFVALTQRLATKLTSAQSAPGIKGGIVVILQASIAGTPRKRLIAVVKAESDSGFRDVEGEDVVKLEFIEKLFLGAHQKLFKIGCFVELERVAATAGSGRSTSEFSTIVFDHQMNPNGEKSAALYFFKTFMGCIVAENARYKTRQFFEYTTEFINEKVASVEDRVDLKNKLSVYLRSEKPNLSVSDFADEFLRQEVHADFKKHMKTKKFSTKAIVKDTSTIKNRLKMRRFYFPSKVRITGPEEAFNDAVRFDGSKDGWTIVRIAGAPTEE